MGQRAIGTNLKVKVRDWIAWCKRQAYHFVFISSLLALTLLVTWWAIFLYQSVNQYFDTKLEAARQSVYSYTLFLGHNTAVKPEPGPYQRDQRLEIVHAHSQPGPYARELAPFWNGLWLQPREEVIRDLEEKRERRHLMVLGESGFLVLLILVSGLMIYRMYWLEKRTTQELHELWSRVSHEIKTPITGVKAFLETLQSQNLSREEIEPLLELALKQVDRQQQLTENMLIGQKIKRGGSGVKLTRLKILCFIKTYIEKHPMYVSKGNVTLVEPEATAAGTTISADPEALRIIFANLFENAFKYGGSGILISISIEQVSKQVRVIFEDNGPGFEPGMAEYIFKAYKRLGSELPGKEKGTGMGLYICRRLARKMGGNLSAQSEGKGKGARFILTLKKARTKKTPDGEASATQ
jgi:signal transduction histidine kinase